MNLRTQFQLDKSEFAWVRQFWKNSQQIQNLKKFECFNRFWPNSIPKLIVECNIFVYSFRTIARISRKARKSYHVLFPKNSKSHKITDGASIVIKILTIKGFWLLHWCTKFHIGISSRLWVIGVWNVRNRAHLHARTHTHTSGRQLKITFFDVLDYSEYSDTNISEKFFFTKTASLVRKQKHGWLKNTVSDRFAEFCGTILLIWTCKMWFIWWDVTVFGGWYNYVYSENT